MSFEDELRRRRRLGDLVGFAGAQETLNRYVTETWAQTHAVTLAPKTAKHDASLYDLHVEPYWGAEADRADSGGDQSVAGRSAR